MDRIKVVFVHHELLCGGTEQALFDLVTLLDTDKFEISVFVQHDTGAWDQKFQDAGIRVVYDYSCRKATLNPITKIGNLFKKLRTQKAYRQNGRGLLDVCFPEGVDIVVSYSVWENEQMIFAKNAKTIKYIHADVETNQYFREQIMSSMETLRKFDRIICVSEAAKYSFVQMTGLNIGVETHFNPINSEKVRRLSEEPVNLPLDVPLISAVGRLSHEKGFERLIIIHKRLLDQGIVHRLVLVGDGEDREFLKRLINATETQNSIIMTGYQRNPYPYMKASRFLVNTSFTEGLPVIAMEALSLGIPMIAPISSVGEVFGEEMCGLITKNTMGNLEEGIRKMLTDDDFYNQCKAGSLRRSSFFDGRTMVQEIEEMLLDLAEKKGENN